MGRWLMYTRRYAKRQYWNIQYCQRVWGPQRQSGVVANMGSHRISVDIGGLQIQIMGWWIQSRKLHTEPPAHSHLEVSAPPVPWYLSAVMPKAEAKSQDLGDWLGLQMFHLRVHLRWIMVNGSAKEASLQEAWDEFSSCLKPIKQPWFYRFWPFTLGRFWGSKEINVNGANFNTMHMFSNFILTAANHTCHTCHTPATPHGTWRHAIRLGHGTGHRRPGPPSAPAPASPWPSDHSIVGIFSGINIVWISHRFHIVQYVTYVTYVQAIAVDVNYTMSIYEIISGIWIDYQSLFNGWYRRCLKRKKLQQPEYGHGSMWHNGAHLADLEAQIYTWHPTNPPKHSGKTARNQSRPKKASHKTWDPQNGSKWIVSNSKSSQVSTNFQSQKASISTVVLIISRHPISPGAFSVEIDDLDDTPTALRRYGAPALRPLPGHADVVPRAQLIGDVLRISPAATAIMDVSTNVGMINVDQRWSREFGKSQRFHSDSLLPQASVLG